MGYIPHTMGTSHAEDPPPMWHWGPSMPGPPRAPGTPGVPAGDTPCKAHHGPFVPRTPIPWGAPIPHLYAKVLPLPPLHPTVSNAGVGMIGPLECQSLAAMQGLMDTNFFGLVRLVKEVLPDMKRRRSGHIVVISSVMGLQGMGGRGAGGGSSPCTPPTAAPHPGIVFNDVYAASKFAVEGFCESLVVQALRFNVV